MPQVVKQKPPNPSRNSHAVNGSILDRAVPVANLPHAPLKILLYGPNRSGKTTLACDFAKPLLLVSFEPAMTGGAESVRKVPGVTMLRQGEHFFGKLGTVQLANELKANSDKYKTVVIDSATSVQDMILCEILDLPAAPDQMSWGMVTSDQYRARSEQTREVLRPFLDLPIDTIVLATEKDHNPPKEERVSASGKVQPDMRPRFLRGLHTESFIAANLGGATADWLHNSCDCICRLFVEEEVVEQTIKIAGKVSKQHHSTGKYVRYLRLAYHPNYAAGVRSCVPEGIPEVLVKPTAAALIKLLRGV